MSKSKLVLGKGLGALIPSVVEATERSVSVQRSRETRDDGTSIGIIAHIPVDKIQPNPYQPRLEFDSQTLKELAQSIIQKGVIQPITVRRFGKGEYQLITGERRVRACSEAKINFIPAYIIEISSKEEMLELALIENIQRERLNPIEIAHSYQRLINECRYTQDQIAQRIGKDRTTVANFIRLLKLPELIQKSLIKNEISMGHARALINIPHQKDQLSNWEKIIRERLSVRNVEKLVQELDRRSLHRKEKDGKTKKSDDKTYAVTEDLISKLKTILGTKIKVHAQKSGKGKIEIEFYSFDDFERISDLLFTIKNK